jgi:hypothetical protein
MTKTEIHVNRFAVDYNIAFPHFAVFKSSQLEQRYASLNYSGTDYPKV